MKILVDSHEPEKLVKLFRKEIEERKLDYVVEVKTLPVGDIVCEEKGVVIERKEIQDFGNSMDGHLQKQLLQMKQFQKSYLIISGTSKDAFFAKRYRTDRQHCGSIASIMIRYKPVEVMWVNTDKQLVCLAISLLNKIDDGKTIDIRNTELLKTHITTDDIRLCVLTSFPGIGRKRGEKMLENQNVLDAITNLFSVVEVHRNKCKHL